MSLEIELPDFDEEIVKHKGVKKYIQFLADAWFKTPLRIAFTMLLILSCFVLVGWNLERLEVIDELVLMEVGEFDLEQRQSDLEIRLSTLEKEGLAEQLARENEKVFQGFPELAAWADGLIKIAALKQVEMVYQVEPAHFSAIPGILEVPLRLEFKANEQYADSLFKGALSLLGFVLRDRWHIDVISTQGVGNGEQLQSIEVRAQVWVRDLFGFVDVEKLRRELEADADEYAQDDEEDENGFDF